MPLKAVFFDLDGTLLDTSIDLSDALNYLLIQQGLPKLPYNVIRQHVSNGANALIKLGFGEVLSEREMLELRQGLLNHYSENIANATEAFPGILELLGVLQKHKLAWGVVTNKPSLYTNSLMAKIPFSYQPAAIVSPDDVGASKPNPKPLLYACELAGCESSEAIYIGDHIRDIECGHNAGMSTIAVGYGFTANAGEHLNWNATHSVDHADEIWPLLQRYLV